MRNYILITSIFLLLISCDRVQHKLENAKLKIEDTELNLRNITTEEWVELEIIMEGINSDLVNNRDKFTDEQIREVGRLQGRYASVLIKKQLIDFDKAIKDYGIQIEGFIEGITETDSTKY